MAVDDLGLWGHDMVLGDGTTVSGITASQLHGFTGTCADGLPPAPGRLCSAYEVSVDAGDGLLIGAALQVDGHPLSLVLQNSAPLTLAVDRNAMRFRCSGGPLAGDVEVGGRTLHVEVSLSLEGPFTNLSPVADVAETQAVWECGDGGLADVTLSAAASTDELDPSDIAGFDWYEDRGTLAEHHLGSGATLTAPMVFGTHDLTLLVTDSAGARSSTDFTVEVADSRIDSIQVPPDRWVRAQASQGTVVTLGEATASDICSPEVAIANDAPPTGVFPTGFTPVTWSFDDRRGNLVRRVQRVFVVPPDLYPPPVSEIEVIPAHATPDQPVAITHHTWPQGRGMFLDEYIIVRNDDGAIWSIDESGAVRPGLVPRARRVNLGVVATTVTAFSGIIAPQLDGPGRYRVQALLLRPGADPADRSGVVGWSEAVLFIAQP